MILTEDQLPQHLGKDLESRLDRFSPKLKETLRSLDKISRQTTNMSLLDYLTVQYQQETRSIRDLAEECGIAKKYLSKIFEEYNIPKRTQAEGVKANWQDPEFRSRNAEAVRTELKERWQDPEFRARHAEAVRANWQDPEFRARNAEATKAMLEERWRDPEFRARNAEATIANWQDSEFRARHAEATRATRLDKANEGKFYLPTIQGIRKDVGYAKSAWEANLMRVFELMGRDYRTHEKVRLKVTEEYQKVFKDSLSDMEVDFIVTDPRGNISMYEIMAHPLEDQTGAAKLEMLMNQYPSIRVKPITPRLYRRLEKRFKDRINTDVRFAGWEDKESNLDNDQKRYGVESLEKS